MAILDPEELFGSEEGPIDMVKSASVLVPVPIPIVVEDTVKFDVFWEKFL